MEQTEMTMVGLLEILAFRSGCMYLSDLQQPRLLPAIRRALYNIPPEQFSLWEWQDAVAYITEESLSFESPEQAADYLKNYRVRQETGGNYET
mgnify:CR=1 FL=1